MAAVTPEAFEQMVTQLNALRQTVGQQQQAHEQLQVQYRQTLIQHTEAMGRLQGMLEANQKAMVEQMEKLAKTGGNRGGQMAVDTKGVGKPNVFDSDPKRWHPFSFRYANYADALFKGAAALLDWAAEQEDEITDLSGAV